MTVWPFIIGFACLIVGGIFVAGCAAEELGWDWSAVVIVIFTVGAGFILGGGIAAIINHYVDKEVETEMATAPQYEHEEQRGEYTDAERYLVAQIVYLESGTCSETAWRMVTSVILNQKKAGYWGSSVYSVVSNGNNYTSFKFVNDNVVPPQRLLDVVNDVLDHGSELPSKVMYFRSGHDHEWDGYENYAVVDNIYFGYFTNGSH